MNNFNRLTYTKSTKNYKEGVHTVRDRCYQEQGQLHCTVGEDVQFNQGWVGSGEVRSKGIAIPRPQRRRERSRCMGKTGQTTNTNHYTSTAVTTT